MIATDHYYKQTLPDTGLSFRMVQIPGGQFMMGSPKDDKDAYDQEKPQHPVRLDGFWMAEHLVTQALWELVLGENPAYFKGAQRPVEQVSWFDAAVFCNALSKQCGRKPIYLTESGAVYGWVGGKWQLPNEGDVQLDGQANGYRLPTEAEWEFAARGGALHEGANYQYAGSDLLDQVGWYRTNSGEETQEVGLLMPNELGLYDMSGNVWEWCQEWYGNYGSKAIENPPGPEKGVDRVIRGGSWVDVPLFCRPAYRDDNGPDVRNNDVGFRLVLQSVG